jgi:predicted SprT family Zn-dependent metalloprotease
MENNIKLLGYVIMRNIHFRIGDQTVNGTKWQEAETGFEIDYVKKKIYKYKCSVDEAIEQLKKHEPNDEYKSYPVYYFPNDNDIFDK